MDIEARITSDKWFQDIPQEPKRCRCCGKNWVTREVVCRECRPIFKYRRADYYWLRSVEINALDMGVQAWA
jgi:hypothetical protein